MNLAMWGKALTVIPRLEKAEWKQLDVVAKWLISTRSAVLIITVIPCVIAGLLAIRAGRFDPTLWLLVTIGLVMAHATNNLLNDLIDHRMGVDKNNYFRTQYGVQPLESGLMSMRQNLLYAALTGLVALACGAYLVYVRGGPTLWLLSAGAFLVVFYTWPLKYIGLGEVAVLVVWGPLMIGGGYFVITGQWDWRVVLASLPYALGATSVIFGKHIDKFGADKAKHIHTLPVLLGETVSRYTAIGMMFAQYLLVGYLVLAGYFSAALLLVVLAAGAFVRAVRVYSRPRPAAPPPDYPATGWPLWYVAFSFVHNRVFGLWFLAGLGTDVILHRVVA
ncbi:MAG TPA: prenyltransferase [Rhizomicrobium sp.]|nr:prenyltransferase [Rhizomicrobium sp.]